MAYYDEDSDVVFGQIQPDVELAIRPSDLWRYPVTGHPARDPAARLWLVQEFTVEQMKQALHTPDLQPAVKTAINKRLARLER